MPATERPWTVSAFETLSIILIAAGLIFSQGFSAFDIFFALIMFGLVLWISRGKSKIARLIFSVLFAFGVGMVALAIVSAPTDEINTVSKRDWALVISASCIYAIQIWLVWCRKTDQWIGNVRATELAN